jgi:type IV pilus assembly protein PilP
MTHWKHLAALVATIALAALACQKQAAGPAVADYQKQRAALIAKNETGGTAAAAMPHALPAEGGGDATDYVYDPIGKRDPFRSFILDRVKEADKSAKGPLEQFDLSQLSVTGVVWETDRRRALVLDPSGQNYIVQEGDPIGKNDGRVIGIDDSRVLVREAYVDFHGEKTTKEIEMRVRQSQGG